MSSIESKMGKQTLNWSFTCTCPLGPIVPDSRRALWVLTHRLWQKRNAALYIEVFCSLAESWKIVNLEELPHLLHYLMTTLGWLYSQIFLHKLVQLPQIKNEWNLPIHVPPGLHIVQSINNKVLRLKELIIVQRFFRFWTNCNNKNTILFRFWTN